MNFSNNKKILEFCNFIQSDRFNLWSVLYFVALLLILVLFIDRQPEIIHFIVFLFLSFFAAYGLSGMIIKRFYFGRGYIKEVTNKTAVYLLGSLFVAISAFCEIAYILGYLNM